MYKNTKKALEIILKEEYDKENPYNHLRILTLATSFSLSPKEKRYFTRAILLNIFIFCFPVIRL